MSIVRCAVMLVLCPAGLLAASENMSWVGTLILPRPVVGWTEQAGRRPFLWVNRVGATVQHSFSRPAPGTENRVVFAGDLLPRELNRLFEGVHFNTSLYGKADDPANQDDPRELEYLATAADFVWDPR